MAVRSTSSSRNSKTRTPIAQRPPLPERISVVLYEVRWLALGLLSAYVGLVLFGYTASDPGWSHAARIDQIANPGGRFGAWLADFLLSLFGFSAWWWVVFLGYGLQWALRHLRHEKGSLDRRSFAIILLGFWIALCASSAFENLRFHSHGGNLPDGAGGVLGIELGFFIQTWLGFTGATLLLLGALAIGISLFCGFSWLSTIERFGAILENTWLLFTNIWGGWHDRRAGQEVARVREEKNQSRIQKSTAKTTAPLRIEPAISSIDKSDRAEKERQQTLFSDLGESSLPPLSLLDSPPADNEPPSDETLAVTSRLIESKLADFNIEVTVSAAYPGPVVTRYEIEPATGVKGSQILNLAKDLARSLSLVSIRVVETVPGKSCMALELPNLKRQTVRLSEIIGSKTYSNMQSPLTVVLGKDISGQPVVADLAKMPHLLVAGTTGSGKSVGINAMILSLLYKSEPARVRLIMVDPKMLELSIYDGIPHLLAPVITDMRHAGNALNWCVTEMDRRYKLMAALGVRNISGYNKSIIEAQKTDAPLTNPFSLTPEDPERLETLPQIVIVIDELADMMMVVGKKVEELIARLAQKARAAGIHLIVATQRPSVDVITGLIKANIPTRIAFQVSSKIDSRTILDQMGAETLLGMGDMLYLAPGGNLPVRVHGAFVADEEVHKVVDHLKKSGAPNYIEGILDAAEDNASFDGGGSSVDGSDGEADPLYDQAVEIVLKTRRPSISLVQRNLRIGYNRSARLIEQMERAGLISPPAHNGNREVLAPAPEET